MPWRFLKPSAVPGYLHCSICMEVFNTPSRLDCGHTFCKDCSLKWYRSSKTCPTCRKRISKKYISIDLIAVYAINDLQVICMHKGCNWSGIFEQYPIHDTQCLFHPSRIEESISSKIPQQVFDDYQDIDPPEQCLLAKLYSNHPNLISSLFKVANNHKACELIGSTT